MARRPELFLTMDDVSRIAAAASDADSDRGPRAIAFFVRALVGGGAQRDMILLANAFAAREERPVELLTLVPSGPLLALVDPRVTLVTVPGGQLRSALPGLRRMLKARRPAILVGAEAATNVLVLLATRLLPRESRPLVVLREVSSPSIGRRHDPYRQTRFAYAALRLIYRWADVVVTLTEGARLDLRANFGIPDAKLVRATSNAVIGATRETEEDAGEARDPNLVVSVGRLSDEKDHVTLLKAFARLDRPGLRLAIYGTGPTEAGLARLIDELGLGDRVSLEGFVADPFPIFRRAALMVSSSRFEGFGNVIVEALSCGTPVVATDCPYGPAEILDRGRYGHLVPVGDADAMARAIGEALREAPDREALRARAAVHTVGRAAAVLAEIVARAEGGHWRAQLPRTTAAGRGRFSLESARPAHHGGETPPLQGRRDGGDRAVPSRRAAMPVLRCRSIEDDDLEAVVRLLGRAFPARTAAYWTRGLARHVARCPPADLPRYGFLLEADGTPVGVLLTLHTDQGFRPGGGIRCNLSSWYVDPRFRPQAALLDRMAARNADVTYVNVTPAPHTWPLLEVNGFVRHGRGQILAVPILARRRPGVSVRAVAADDPLDELDPSERRLVRDHVGFGCLGFVWTDGETCGPLLLQPRRIGLAGLVPGLKIPCLHVVYCRSVADLPRIAAALGRLLLGRYRRPLLLVDAVGPLKGLPGRFFANRGVKFTRGPNPVKPGDLAYTEIVMFGP